MLLIDELLQYHSADDNYLISYLTASVHYCLNRDTSIFVKDSFSLIDSCLILFYHLCSVNAYYSAVESLYKHSWVYCKGSRGLSTGYRFGMDLRPSTAINCTTTSLRNDLFASINQQPYDLKVETLRC